MTAEPGGRASSHLPARLALAALFLLLAALAVERISSPDVGWQLATGRLIAERARVPATDVFSYVARGRPWIELRWLWDLLLYAGLRLGGPALLILAKTVILAAAFFSCVRPAPHARATIPGLAILTLGMAAASGRFGLRPEIVTYLLTPIFLERLTRLGERRRILDGSLPALQILWTNLHSLFLVGPIAAVCFALGRSVRALSKAGRPGASGTASPCTSVDRTAPRADPASLLAPFLLPVLLALCTLINPYGLRGALEPIRLFQRMRGTDLFGRVIGELRSPFALPTWSLDLVAAGLLAAATLATFLANRRRFDFGRFAFFIAALYTAGSAMRNVGFFAIVATWTALRNLEEHAVEPAERGRVLDRTAGIAKIALVAACLFATWTVATDRWAARTGRPIRFGLGFAPEAVPEEAVRDLMAAGAKGRVFSGLADAGWISWFGERRYPIFLDGRLEVFDENALRAYSSAGKDWDRFADRWGVRIALLSPHSYAPLIRQLAASPRWALVHVDSRAVVFLRDLPEQQAAIRQLRIKSGISTGAYVPRGPEPDERRRGIARRLGARAIPWYSRGMAEAFLALGRRDDAVLYLARTLALDPEDLAARGALAELEIARGHPERARALLDGAP